MPVGERVVAPEQLPQHDGRFATEHSLEFLAEQPNEHV